MWHQDLQKDPLRGTQVQRYLQSKCELDRAAGWVFLSANGLGARALPAWTPRVRKCFLTDLKVRGTKGLG